MMFLAKSTAQTNAILFFFCFEQLSALIIVHDLPMLQVVGLESGPEKVKDEEGGETAYYKKRPF